MRRRDMFPALLTPLALAPVAFAQAPQAPATAPGGPSGGFGRGGSGGRGGGRGGPPQPLPPSSVVVAPRKGRIKQGVTGGVFGGLGTLDERCREAARLGIKGFDLVNTPAEWAILKKYGIIPTMYQGPAGVIGHALNRKEFHDALEASTHAGIDQAAANGIPNIITFSGLRAGMPFEEGADNCVLFLNKVKAHAEDKGITLCMEYLNSKVNHKDYMFDHIAWGVDVMKRVNSPRVKILYDIYHAQIQDGDIVRNIRDNFQWIGHFHTGGNPGRKEIDETQELNYHFIAGAIADLNYTGYISHEYSPTAGHDPIAMLEKAIEICDA